MTYICKKKISVIFLKHKFLILTMKLSFILVLIASLNVSAHVFSQSISLRTDIQNMPIKEVLKTIELQGNYRFFYSDDYNVLDKKVNLKAQNADIKVILDQVFRDTPASVEYMEGNIVIITPFSKQGITVNGTVSDAEGSLPGVNVTLKGTINGVVTDANGRYQIEVNDPNAVLAFSFVGYVTYEVVVGNQRNINVTLMEDTQTIEEVVVVGYGTVKKRDLTGAVSTIKASDMNFSAAASVGHALQGKAAGLSVVQNSAQPGGGLDILVRGAGSVNASNRPLYIVDGFPIATPDQPGSSETRGSRMDPGTQSILNFINPNDIASIEVLKDASATAIYGSRAANGVVLVTTKHGKEGKPVVAFSATHAIQKYTDVYDVFNLKEWMDEMNISTWDLWMYTNNVIPYGRRTLEEALQYSVPYRRPYTDKQIEEAGEGTDWISLVTRTGKIEQYNMSLQGGTSSTRYSASVNYFDHEGIIKNSRMRRYTGRLNFEQDINKYFKTTMSIIASRLNNDNTPLGDGEWEKSGLIRAAVQMGPNIEAKLPDGSYPINPQLATQPNPYSLLENTDNTIMDRVLANASVTAEPIKNLFLKYHVGLDRSHQTRNIYEPKSTLHGGNTGGNAIIYLSDNEQYLSELTANYSLSPNNDHKINILVGYSYEKFKSSSNSLGNNDFLTDAFLWYNLNSGAGIREVGSSGSENKMVSVFGRINYTLLDRFLFTATLRADGASIFARNHKWGYFPSMAVGWNMADEEFMGFSKSFVNMWKWRVSYGQTGNADIGSNAFASYYAQPAYAREDKSRIIGVFQQRLENPDLKWETTTEMNIGLDISLWKGNISATFEFYNRVISDLLNMKPLNAYHDISFVMANIGKTQSRGFEFTLNTRNVTKKDFSWSTDYTFTIYKDRWLERTDDWKPTVYENVTDPIRPVYARKTIGIMQADEAPPIAQPDLRPGQFIIADLNGYQRDASGNPAVNENGRFLLTGGPDDIIDEADTRLLNSRDPGFLMGLTNIIRYKQFDFSFNFYGMFDRIMQDPTKLSYGYDTWGMAQFGYNRLRSVKNRWLPSNPSTEWPSSFFNGSRYGNGDFFYEKAWFIRLQNITLGYTLPSNILSNVFSSCRIHLDVNNVLVFTPYGGLDPETDAYPAAYPNARTFTFGIDLKF